MHKTGITSRITIIIILVAILSAGLTGILAYAITKQQFSRYVDLGTSSMGESIALEVSSYYDANGDFNGLQQYLQSRTYFPEDRKGPGGLPEHRPFWRDEVLVLDHDHRVAASSRSELLGSYLSLNREEFTVFPVLSESQEIAWVYIFNPLKRGVISMENQFLDSIASQTANAILITIALALIIGVVLARGITRPINSLSQAIHNLARGDLESRVELKGDREFIQLSEDFNYMAQQLYEHEQSRNSLVANIAHELRTPLSILRGQLEALQTGSMDLTDQVKSSLVDEIIRLTRLVKELETVGLAESGALRLNIQRISTAEVLERILPLRLVMEEEGIEFKVEMDEPGWIHADINRLTQILINLLSNAMQHTSRENGVIAFKINRSGEQIQFSVADNGPGIPERDLPYIFDRFYRTDEARSRREGGSGLGLAIARSYVRAHGGTIWVQSEEGKGSEFYFTLPYNQADLKSEDN
jgi:signal transduction histidine kinase